MLKWASKYFNYNTEIKPGCISITFGDLNTLYNYTSSNNYGMTSFQKIIDNVAKNSTPQEIQRLNRVADYTVIIDQALARPK